VTLTTDASGTLRVGTVSSPETWESRDARITSVGNRSDQDITLSHTDGRNATVTGISIPAHGATAAFNGMGVEGSWTAQLHRFTQGMPASPIELVIGWTAMA
jgi:hypothetical protein